MANVGPTEEKEVATLQKLRASTAVLVEQHSSLLRDAEESLKEVTSRYEKQKALLQSIESERTAIKTFQTDLGRKQKEYRVSLKKLNSQLRPVKRAPADVLMQIFNATAYQNGHPDLRQATRLSHVCQSWRAVALKMGDLWTLVQINSTRSHKRIAAYIARTAARVNSSPVTVELTRLGLFKDFEIGAPEWVAGMAQVFAVCDLRAFKSIAKLKLITAKGVTIPDLLAHMNRDPLITVDTLRLQEKLGTTQATTGRAPVADLPAVTVTAADIDIIQKTFGTDGNGTEGHGTEPAASDAEDEDEDEDENEEETDQDGWDLGNILDLFPATKHLSLQVVSKYTIRKGYSNASLQTLRLFLTEHVALERLLSTFPKLLELDVDAAAQCRFGIVNRGQVFPDHPLLRLTLNPVEFSELPWEALKGCTHLEALTMVDHGTRNDLLLGPTQMLERATQLRSLGIDAAKLTASLFRLLPEHLKRMTIYYCDKHLAPYLAASKEADETVFPALDSLHLVYSEGAISLEDFEVIVQQRCVPLSGKRRASRAKNAPIPIAILRISQQKTENLLWKSSKLLERTTKNEFDEKIEFNDTWTFSWI